MTTIGADMAIGQPDLAATVDAVMAAGTATLSVFDAASDRWDVRDWRDVRVRAIEIATWICAERQGGAGAIGLIGDPSVDLIAAVHGTWLSGSAVSILPGPVRGADENRWAAATAARFVDIGVDIVLGGGAQLDALTAVDTPVTIARVTDIGIGGDTAGFVPRPLSPDAPAILQGTAGSTGDPKTAILSARAVATNTAALVDRLRLDGTRDVGLSWLPLYHDMGLTFLLATMYSGMSLRIAPNSAFAASPFRWAQWLTESRATVTAAPNFAYDMVGRYRRLLAGADLSHLRVAISGGEPIDPDAFDRFIAEAALVGFDPSAAVPAYGMAESTCAVTVPQLGDGARYDDVGVRIGGDDGEIVRRRYPMLGEPLSGMEIRIVEPEVDAPVIEGRTVGTVEIRGTSMMDGYLGHRPLEVGDWFATGDLGYLVDGQLVICGRAKEIVIVAGRNLFPVEIERAAAAVPGVRRGGVVAVAKGERSPRPGLIVIAETRSPETSRSETASGLRAAIMTEVTSACGVVPAAVILVGPGAVPRTTSGKLRRLEARRLVESGELA